MCTILWNKVYLRLRLRRTVTTKSGTRHNQPSEKKCAAQPADGKKGEHLPLEPPNQVNSNAVKIKKFWKQIAQYGSSNWESNPECRIQSPV